MIYYSFGGCRQHNYNNLFTNNNHNYNYKVDFSRDHNLLEEMTNLYIYIALMYRSHLICPDTTDGNDGAPWYMNIWQNHFNLPGNPLFHLLSCQLIVYATVGLVKLSDSDSQPSILKYCCLIGKCNEGRYL